ncbi:DNA recombination protein RmuC [Nonlabens ulvanivorans]|uniref:DNA polymerase V n=1 Tax=Nonlabens ulvanivorans TaxID=906888 RepID=A0A084K0E2_NONUL|nr:DNA recombination protein RmuC [Nonlabens ulvanivorans]KEZ94676.1 DNA polymerase V [Nonlabens ulvanivorans]PRX12108.1 DNA recombination protein RmuC [Nonlabens ulvanivorans]
MSSELSVLLFVLLGVILGAVVTWLFMKTRFSGSLNLLESEKSQLSSQLQHQKEALIERDQLRLESSNLKAQIASKLETQQDLNQRLDKLEKQYIEVNREKNNLEILLAEQRTSFEKANEKHAEAQQEIEKLNEKFTKEFENLANKILDEKSSKFTDQNKKNIEQILNPLQEKILMFEKRVEDTHKDTIERQSILKQQIIGLKELNEQMSKETTNLTKALKGDAKMRGNWGELVLERVLEKSGLEKGSEYEVQQSFKTEEGKTVFPDVVINLPGGKKMIIDSKVSLNAYERFVNEENEEIQDRHLKEHVNALKKHVNDLSGKNYHELYQIESPDFVLLFVPIEPAFAMALNADSNLYSEAFDKNIVIVTPTTLLATLRTIDTMWQNEKQQKNALDIANAAGGLYDKFVLLTEDLIKVGSQLDTVKKSYSSSMNKLTEGSGNLIGRVERLKKLGAKANKSLNEKLLNRAIDNDPDFLEGSDEEPRLN